MKPADTGGRLQIEEDDFTTNRGFGSCYVDEVLGKVGRRSSFTRAGRDLGGESGTKLGVITGIEEGTITNSCTYWTGKLLEYSPHDSTSPSLVSSSFGLRLSVASRSSILHRTGPLSFPPYLQTWF